MKDQDKSNEFPKLSQPAQRALANAGIQSLKELAGLTEKEFLSLHGIGKSALPPVKAAMAAKGLAFKS